MSSFDISYDEEEDVLEVTFGEPDEAVTRTLPLNDNILIHSEITLQNLWGLSFFSYSKLLGVSETEFTSISALTQAQQDLVIRLLSTEPGSLFFDVTYPDALIARIKTPNLRSLI